jgi:glycosyltransferase involved in cell wall biosynthesis
MNALSTPSDILVLADEQTWLRYWPGVVQPFEDATIELLSKFRTVILAPSDVKYTRNCLDIIDWKRQLKLEQTRLILGTYKGRHLWARENDHLVDYWVVHARSEQLVLDSDRLVFIPLCVVPPLVNPKPGDDGYIFMGGRKWRELDAGVMAMTRSGKPGRVISDFAPEGDFPGVQILRERVPKPEYSAVLARSRLFLVPLRRTPISHGHVDVVTAILVGKPVLVTAGASCDDYVKHGVNGLLVRDNSVEAWVDAIQEGWERADEFAAAAREMAPRYHAQKYAEYLHELATYRPE